MAPWCWRVIVGAGLGGLLVGGFGMGALALHYARNARRFARLVAAAVREVHEARPVRSGGDGGA